MSLIPDGLTGDFEAAVIVSDVKGNERLAFIYFKM
jgi:hypothetical protein